jgi:AraC-like DNA-binding protein
MLVLLYPLASWLLSMGFIITVWYAVLPIFIYAIFPETKLIRWLLWYGLMLLMVFGLGYMLRYTVYGNAPISYPKVDLVVFLWPNILNTTAALLFVIHSLFYINRFYQIKISNLERLLEIQNDENIQNMLDISYDEQYKFREIYEKIINYLEATRSYLNGDLKIGNISNNLNVNILYIQKAISLHRNMNFNNFINSYRVDHAKKMIQENNQYKLEYIYLSSGFKNQSSFNRAFKTLEGVTPSDYRKQIAEYEEVVD